MGGVGTADLPGLAYDEAAAAAAWRAASRRTRWRAARMAAKGDRATRPEMAALVLHAARRELQRPWTTPLVALAYLVPWSIGYLLGARHMLAGGIAAGLMHAFLQSVHRMPRWRQAVIDNADVLRLPPPLAANLAGPSRRVAVGVSSAVAVIAAALAVHTLVPPAAFRGPLQAEPADPAGGVAGLGLPSFAVIPVHPPETLVDGGPPGDVPPAVVAGGFGDVIVAARRGPLPDTASACGEGGLDWREGPTYHQPVIGPTSYLVIGEGVANGPNGPLQQLVVCEYEPDGTLADEAPAMHPDELPVNACMGSGGASATIDGIPFSTCDEAVPDGADWALHDQGRWTLAVPVGDLPVVRTRYGVDARQVPSDPTFGELRFLSDGGQRIDPDAARR